MQRDLGNLAGPVHDLLVVGGGIQGACIAWDAVLRGLKVALVERDDFGAATSANSLRIVHGGLRYLARGDLIRMWESTQERATLLRIAPGLVEPLPVLVSTRGIGTQSRLALGAALALNDLSSIGRNRGLPADRRIPTGRLLTGKETAGRFPPLAGSSMTGGALWHDARIRRPERLTLSFVRSAAERGAVVANYVEVERLLTSSGSVTGVDVADSRTGSKFQVRAHAIVLAAGPWTETLLGTPTRATPTHALALNIVVGRRLADTAVGIKSLTGPAEDPVVGGHRFLFLAPQDGATLLGTWYAIDDGADPRPKVEQGTAALLAEFNAACPGLSLSPADIARVQWGRLPLKAGREPGRPSALAERPRIGNHASEGVRHLFSVEGVKYTTARRVAATAVDRILGDLGVPNPGCRTAATPLSGAYDVPPDDPQLETRIREAVRNEMALTLGDVVFRRTGLGEAPGPDHRSVCMAARIAARELGWDSTREAAEVEDVMRQEVVA
jgi:glycerol-3-phosphate dehydrogenase